MKKGLYFIAFLVVFIFITGMGGLGGTPANKIPTPEKDFSATIIDKQDTVTKCKQVSREGDVFFLGKKGSGTVTIPFEKINTAEFESENNAMNVVVQLTDNQTIKIKMDKNQTFYGMTSFGTFQIGIIDLKKITFVH
ncbi:MAG: hypothetical protein ABIJ37_08235 [Pseudomonadota bacterium]